MLRKLAQFVLALSIGVPLASGGTAIIVDSLKDPNGQLFSGHLVIMLSSSVGQMLKLQTAAVEKGSVALALDANDTFLPAGTHYRVLFLPTKGGSVWSETWLTRSSELPVSLKSVRLWTAFDVPALNSGAESPVGWLSSPPAPERSRSGPGWHPTWRPIVTPRFPILVK